MNNGLTFWHMPWLCIIAAIVVPASVNAGTPIPHERDRAPKMFYADTDYGRPFAKDPDVVRFQGRYLMYYSLNRRDLGFAVGIAQSTDLTNWQKVGEILPSAGYEKRGLAAPCAIVLNGQVHLFYQTYGNGRKDAICHAVSDDGLHIQRNPSNPVFSPTGASSRARSPPYSGFRRPARMMRCAAPGPCAPSTSSCARRRVYRRWRSSRSQHGAASIAATS